MTKVVLIHGYTASPLSHWFPWLKAEVEKAGHTFHAPTLPKTNEPVLQEWLQELHQEIPRPDEGTYFVAHSLGCVTLLKFLESLSPAPQIGGLLCVAGFVNDLSALPSLRSFTQEACDFKKVHAMTTKRAVILSENDSIVPPAWTEDLAVKLEVTPHRISKGGHFLGSEGFRTLPLAWTLLQDMIQRR